MRAPILAVLTVLAPARAALPVQSFTLDSGLHCLLLENHERPLLRLELVNRWEPGREPAAGNGMTTFLAEVLRSTGAGPYSLAAFNRAMDDLGLAFTFRDGQDGWRWSLAADSRSQEAAFELLAHAVFRPTFDGPQVQAQRQALIRRSAGRTLRERAEAGFLHSLRHRGAALPPEGVDLAAMGYPDLQTLHRHLVRPENATLAIYGDLSLAQAKELALLHFGVWGPAATAAPALPVGPLAPAAPRLSALLEGATRAECWAGALAPAQPQPQAVRDLLKLLLERAPLAGAEGVTLQCFLGQEPLVIKARAPEAARAALVPALLAELERLRVRGFAQADLERARVLWRGETAALPLHPAQLLQRLLQGGLEASLATAVEAVTLAQLNGALATLLEPDGLRFLLLGADAGLVQAAEQAGLGTAAVVRAEQY